MIRSVVLDLLKKQQIMTLLTSKYTRSKTTQTVKELMPNARNAMNWLSSLRSNAWRSGRGIFKIDKWSTEEVTMTQPSKTRKVMILQRMNLDAKILSLA